MEASAARPAPRRAAGADTPLPWIILTIGVISASVSAILIRYATTAEPLAMAFWRCAAGTLVLLPFALRRLGSAGRSSINVSVLAGVFLALHFATWITSLELTSIGASVLMVSTTPIFVAAFARYVLHERLQASGWAGIGFALAGIAVIAAVDLEGSSLGGDALALVGAVTGGVYALAGRSARHELDIFSYAVVAYGAASVLLLIACVLGDVALSGYETQTWWAIAGMIVGPQLLGHTFLNYALKDIDATTVTVAIMAEPVIAIGLAFLLFEETPSLLVYPAGVAILAGVYLVATARREPAVILE